eukprot:TRINITY_DN3123_c0_g3_i1.p2 TRINITY_DN3123_c0_g3~~TRINITY_DN3123_c0_g3_i1.p2  ORF type:complete len:556 (-),score=90.65 TRINITY_DN3123_c0_g3_i1:1389-3056(-)
MRQFSSTTLRTGLIIAGLLSALPASAATLAVGSGKTYATPCQAFAAAKAGDLVEIQGNQTYSGDVCGIAVSNLTIRGVNGRPKIDAAGKNAYGKGTWVVTGSNVTVENVEMSGARVPDKNGAALRLEGTNFTLRSAYLHDNENGILSNADATSNIVIENSEFGHNGDGSGYTHNLYIGNVASLTFRYNYSHDANVGHNLKSRAKLNTIAYNRFSSLPAGQAGSGAPSYEINLPNAGTTTIIGNVIQQPASNGNPGMIAYGEEGASNPGHDLYVVNNTFLNDDTARGTFVFVGSGVSKPALVQNNIFAGTGTVSTQASTVEKTNYRAAAPGFVNRAAYDLRPTANALVINAGSAPGSTAGGVSLAPVAQYKHVASGETRAVSGALDIGAYEAAGTTTPTPTPAPAPTPSPSPAPAPTSWKSCAAEGAWCSFSGSAQVRYGTADKFVVKTLTGPVACTNAVFGDPAPGYGKSCSVGATTTAPAPAPAPTPVPTTVTWTNCAGEDGTCSVPGTREVRYGYNGYYATKVVTGSVSCSNAVFGDPKPGYAKTCSYSSIAR